MKRTIAEFAKNSRETVRVELDEFKGAQLISARVWFTDGESELRPTSKGLSLAIRHLPALREAISQAEALAIAEGLL